MVKSLSDIGRIAGVGRAMASKKHNKLLEGNNSEEYKKGIIINKVNYILLNDESSGILLEALENSKNG